MNFRFKQFSVRQEKSAMKIGTDSVLLGAFCRAETAGNVLDIGTGTGLLALMLAQKSNAIIDAIETDAAAAQEAAFNFSQSPWNNNLHLIHQRVQDYYPEKLYDLIIANPPYYRHKASMNIADEQRSIARHDKDLTFNELLSCIKRLLSNSGTCWLILPYKEAKELLDLSIQYELHLLERVLVHSLKNKKPNRVIMVLGKKILATKESSFTVYDEDGKPTPGYVELTKDYYLWKEFDSDERLKW